MAINGYIKTCIRSNPTKWTHFGAMSASVGVTLLHDFKIFLFDGLYSVIWYIDIIKQLCICNDFNLLHVTQNIMTEVNVSATAGMSTTGPTVTFGMR